MMFRTVALVAIPLASLLVGCSKDKQEAVTAAEEIEGLCKSGKKDEAAKKGADMYSKNTVFKKSVDAAAANWKVSDVSKFSYCGVAFVEATSRMKT
jgi:hypothetical protein